MIIGIVTGVIGGVIATAIVWLIVRLWNEVVFPRINDVRYRGFRVDGQWKWEAKKEGSDFDLVTLALKQTADKITGTMAVIWVRSGKSTTTTYDFRGHIMDGVLLGTCAPTANSTVSHLSIFATVTDSTSGPKLLLRKTGIDFNTKAISYHDLEFEKNT